jgi:1,4-dihydroxy-2-naphthoate octaprenyltransferase
MKPEPIPTVVAAAPRGWRLWWVAIRPRTLTMAIAPVLVGTALAWAQGAALAWAAALAALLTALAIQAGTNLHNDAADHERGNDTPERVGPLRVTAAGWARPEAVRRAALLAFAAALILGLYLVAVGGWPILALGLASVGAGWAYSGGPRPISHTPLGELFVLCFFGIVAVTGSYYLQSGGIAVSALLAGAALGSFAAAVLMINNYRDLADDLAVGRRTLAAALGRAGARRAYAAMMLLPFVVPVLFVAMVSSYAGALLALLVLPRSLSLVRRLARTEGAALNVLLAETAGTQLLFGVLLALGVCL